MWILHYLQAMLNNYGDFGSSTHSSPCPRCWLGLIQWLSESLAYIIIIWEGIKIAPHCLPEQWKQHSREEKPGNIVFSSQHAAKVENCWFKPDKRWVIHLFLICVGIGLSATPWRSEKCPRRKGKTSSPIRGGEVRVPLLCLNTVGLDLLSPSCVLWRYWRNKKSWVFGADFELL